MSSKTFDSRKPHHKTDDFIQDYLSDILGSPSEPVEKNVSSYTAIPPQYSLIPTIKLYGHNESQKLRPQVEAMIILFTNLYFLRREISPKLRRFILDLSEQVIDDFNAAYWLQVPPRVGAKNEV